MDKLKNIKMYENVDQFSRGDLLQAVDQAQLDEYEKEGHKEITLGDIDYRIVKYFMDGNNVPSLELVMKMRNVHYVQLALVWSGYQNYSALADKEREELRRKYYL